MIAPIAVATAATTCEPAPLVVARALEAHPDVVIEPCVFGDLDVHGRAFVTLPDSGLPRGLALQRARAEAGLASADAQVRIAVLAVRSGGTEGYTGIDGEAVVPVFQIAEARYDLRGAGAAMAAGMVDDPWLMTVQSPWSWVGIERPMIADQGWIDRSDVGGWLGWTAPTGLVSVTAAATTGEGARARERNTGTDLTGVLHVRPLARADAPITVEVAMMARDGSRGVEQARDHRAAAAVIVRHAMVVAGTDGLLGWGLGGDPDLLPAGVSAWARAGDDLPLVGVARVDVATDRRGADDTGERLLLVAGGPRFPLRGEVRPAALMVGWEGRRYGLDAAPIAGDNALVGTDLFFVQLGVRLRGGFRP